MLEKCGSYLHYVKQFEISVTLFVRCRRWNHLRLKASSVLFDGLLEYMNYHNSRSHISYYFSTDLFDRAPYLKDTQLGTLYRMMILK